MTAAPPRWASSRAWDRACELYAELTGGTADYGITHAQRCHARFGAAYPAPLVPGWGADKPIDLVGHSFGGATARLLMQLLADGCPEEVQAAEAAGETPSPLFTGGKAGWVRTGGHCRAARRVHVSRCAAGRGKRALDAVSGRGPRARHLGVQGRV